jgi:hypothetical protein
MPLYVGLDVSHDRARARFHIVEGSDRRAPGGASQSLRRRDAKTRGGSHVLLTL